MQMMTAWSSATKRDGVDPIKDLFGVQFTTTLKCTESDETLTETVSAMNVKCNINQDVSHLTAGIKLSLVEDREKTSETLGRTAAWTGAARISVLPPYLTVQVCSLLVGARIEEDSWLHLCSNTSDEVCVVVL